MRAHIERAMIMAAMFAAMPTGAAERVDAERVVACVAERDDARRLECYDKAVSRAKPQQVAQPPAPVPAVTAPPPSPPVVRPTPAKPKDDFGVSGSAVARQRDDDLKEQDLKDDIRSITAAVTEITSRPHGEKVITLDNGQTWLQKKAEFFPVKAGDQVTINAGTLGSFRIVNGNRSSQVTRIR